jgi:phosphoribosylanthranilate isomerase
MAATRIKICCIANREEAWLAVAHGAAAIGLVSAMPSGPGVIPEDTIAAIAAGMPPALGTFLLTSRTDVEGIVAQQRRCGVNTIQLVDRLESGTHAELRVALPGVAIVQVVHVTGPEALDEAMAIAPHVQALLLDSGNPALPVKELGGTGRTHDWETSKKIRARVAVPVFLAGGLRPDNVAEAVRTVRPYGIDVCSGVRTGGRLDPVKLEAFFAAVQAAL